MEQSLIDSLSSAISQLLTITTNLDNRLTVLETRVDQLCTMVSEQRHPAHRPAPTAPISQIPQYAPEPRYTPQPKPYGGYQGQRLQRNITHFNPEEGERSYRAPKRGPPREYDTYRERRNDKRKEFNTSGFNPKPFNQMKIQEDDDWQE